MRDYRNHLQAVLKRKPATVNNALAAVDDLYIRRGLGPANAARVEVPVAAPRALGERAQVRYLRAVAARPSPRDQALALVPFYAGARIAETVALDVDDVRLSARKGIMRIYGKGQRVREVPIHPQLRAALTTWLHERSDWPGASDTPALFLNQRGARLSVKAAHDIITGIATDAGLDDDEITAHVLRHSFATTLVRGGTDLVIVAELLGHARLETTRGYTRPNRRRPHQSPRPACGGRIGTPRFSWTAFSAWSSGPARWSRWGLAATTPFRVAQAFTQGMSPTMTTERADDLDLDAFCSRTRTGLVGALSLYLGDPGVAEELANDALLRAVDRWEQVREIANPDGWVYAVSFNLARSRYRRLAAERRAHARLDHRSDSTVDHDHAEAVEVRAALGRLPRRPCLPRPRRQPLSWPGPCREPAQGPTTATSRMSATRSL